MTNTKNPRFHPAFTFAYRKFALPLTKFLVKRLHGDQDAVEEVFADTIEAAWKGHHTFANKSNYYTWLCRIALNKAADYYRRNYNRKSFIIAPLLDNIADLDSINPNPEEKLALLELKSALLDCLDLLPPKTRRILHLHFWKELSVKEIAIDLHLSVRSVEGKLYRAKKAYRKALVSHYPGFVPAKLKVDRQ